MSIEQKARTFEEEFDYQVKNGLCGGPLCINPDCFCDEAPSCFECGSNLNQQLYIHDPSVAESDEPQDFHLTCWVRSDDEELRVIASRIATLLETASVGIRDVVAAYDSQCASVILQDLKKSLALVQKMQARLVEYAAEVANAN